MDHFYVERANYDHEWEVTRTINNRTCSLGKTLLWPTNPKVDKWLARERDSCSRGVPESSTASVVSPSWEMEDV